MSASWLFSLHSPCVMLFAIFFRICLSEYCALLCACRMMDRLFGCLTTNMAQKCRNDWDQWEPLVSGIQNRYCSGASLRSDKLQCKSLCVVNSLLLYWLLCSNLIVLSRTRDVEDCQSIRSYIRGEGHKNNDHVMCLWWRHFNTEPSIQYMALLRYIQELSSHMYLCILCYSLTP